MLREPEPGYLATEADAAAWTDAVAAARRARRAVVAAALAAAALLPPAIALVVVGPGRVFSSGGGDDGDGSGGAAWDAVAAEVAERRAAALLAEARAALVAAGGDPEREETVVAEVGRTFAGDADLLARLTALRVELRRASAERESAVLVRAKALVRDRIDAVADDGARRYGETLGELAAMLAEVRGQTARAEVERNAAAVRDRMREERGTAWVRAGARGGPLAPAAGAAPPGVETIGAFAIDVREASNASFAEFLATRPAGVAPPEGWQDGRPPAGKERHPVEGVSRDDARRFAAWRAGRTGRATRLPTRAEWMRAATGGEARRYPWGDEPVVANANVEGGPGNGAAMLVGSLPLARSPFGCHHMAGNVAEWTDDDPRAALGLDASAVVRIADAPADAPLALAVGGSYRTAFDAARVDAWTLLRASARPRGVGFRCVEPP